MCQPIAKQGISAWAARDPHNRSSAEQRHCCTSHVATLQALSWGIVLNSLTAIKYASWDARTNFFVTARHMFTVGGIRPFTKGINATVSQTRSLEVYSHDQIPTRTMDAAIHTRRENHQRIKGGASVGNHCSCTPTSSAGIVDQSILCPFKVSSAASANATAVNLASAMAVPSSSAATAAATKSGVAIGSMSPLNTTAVPPRFQFSPATVDLLMRTRCRWCGESPEAECEIVTIVCCDSIRVALDLRVVRPLSLSLSYLVPVV